jgi:hypothetical protein
MSSPRVREDISVSGKRLSLNIHNSDTSTIKKKKNYRHPRGGKAVARDLMDSPKRKCSQIANNHI